MFKGYVPTKNKKCMLPFKGKSSSELLTYDQVKGLPEYAAILDTDTILIDIDTEDESEILFQIVKDYELHCRVYKTTRGRHFIFKNTNVEKCRTGCKLAIGLTADIKVGRVASYEILKYQGIERPIELDFEDIQEVPNMLKPVFTNMDFLEMEKGDGRNSSLYGYELVLQSNEFEKEEAIETIKIINNYVLAEPLEDKEIETITRDEAFSKPIFYKGTGKSKSFQHDVFAKYLKSEYHIKRLNGQLHVYSGGIYVPGYRMIESKMIEVLPTLKATQRTEVIKYLEITTMEYIQAEPNVQYIAFRNGIYDLETDRLLPFDPKYTITNKIPWDYVPGAYDELADETLNKIACYDKQVRSILEECVGYCFFRQNELSKSFMLTGDGSNGKSTYLDMIKHVLGRENYVSLDLDELSEKFSTTTMFGKLANIGDDISDEFLQGKTVAKFKKIVSGNDIKAEDKGKDVFFYRPIVKVLFSANEIPRARSKGFKALLRRLIIVPFDARFSRDDPDFDSSITWKLKSRQTAEYLIQLGIVGLKRVLKNQDFTESDKVMNRLKLYEMENNPILLFLEEHEPEEIINQETRDVFMMYDVFCTENGYTRVARQTFTKQICNELNITVNRERIDGKRVSVFVKEG